MLILYSTQGCHLCELAWQQVCQLKLDAYVEIIDIAFDDALFSRYGVTIPVLSTQYQPAASSSTLQMDKKHQSNPQELFWPFNIEELQAWLKQNGINYPS